MICKEMGQDPKEEDMPLDPSTLSANCQQALFLFNVLPDEIEGMNGVWLGKSFAGLYDLMEIYSMEDKADIMDLVIVCISEYAKFHEAKRKYMTSKKG